MEEECTDKLKLYVMFVEMYIISMVGRGRLDLPSKGKRKRAK